MRTTLIEPFHANSIPGEELSAAHLGADLHCHSTCSDGTLSPQAVAHRAADNKVALWALTDHDTTAGYQVAREVAAERGLPMVSGVEVSCEFASHSIHVLGLDFDVDNERLQQGLASIRKGRKQRGLRIAEVLRSYGIDGTWEGALAQASSPESISRMHFARHLLDSGACRNMQEAFDKYLGDGKPACVEHVWASLEDTVSWITGACGVAVLAHPGRYRFDDAVVSELIDTFMGCGGLGIEVVSGCHRDGDTSKYQKVAKANGLLASRGSDFHSPSGARFDLGKMPLLDDSLTPVWSRFRR